MQKLGKNLFAFSNCTSPECSNFGKFCFEPVGNGLRQFGHAQGHIKPIVYYLPFCTTSKFVYPPQITLVLAAVKPRQPVAQIIAELNANNVATLFKILRRLQHDLLVLIRGRINQRYEESQEKVLLCNSGYSVQVAMV